MRTALKIDKIVFTTTVSVKIVGTLLCLLVPSMLVYKVWLLNRDKQLWEAQGDSKGSTRRKKQRLV